MCLKVVKISMLLTIMSQTSVIRADKASNSPWDYFFYSNRGSDGGEPCDIHWMPCGPNEVCEETCKCEPFYMRDQHGRCRSCPLEGDVCSNCCFGPMLDCLEGRCVKCHYFGSSMQCVTKEEFYIITAAQITLISAFAILIVVLSGILYHRCTKNSSQNRRRRAIRAGIMSDQISVSSLQQGVLDRLRDAPPKYETRHNYTHQQKTASTRVDEAQIGGEGGNQRGISQISETVQAYGLSAPPPYDPADDRPLSQNPPSYTTATTPEETAKAELYQKLYGEITTTGRTISTDTNI